MLIQYLGVVGAGKNHTFMFTLLADVAQLGELRWETVLASLQEGMSLTYLITDVRAVLV